MLWPLHVQIFCHEIFPHVITDGFCVHKNENTCLEQTKSFQYLNKFPAVLNPELFSVDVYR